MRRADEDLDPGQVRAVEAWAASGAMALTGWPDERPLGPPAGLLPEVAVLDAALTRHAAAAGRRLEVDVLALLGERAAVGGLQRGGRTSCGGATRLLRTRDGWLALALARADDVELLPAWLGVDPDQVGPDGWDAAAAAIARGASTPLAEAGAELGLPVAALPQDPASAGPPLRRTPVRGQDAPLGSGVEGLRVVELGSLWAGPLCGALLGALGATVVKVESTSRPDGARQGPAPFFDLLNAGKRSVALDLASQEGQAALRRLVLAADVVVEASRPRALRGFGLDAPEVLATGRPRVWVSITGHGREGSGAGRVAFGDDAAVAGGLVAWDARGEPVFCADAVADPLTGVTAAVAALDALRDGGRWLLDVPMAGIAARAAGPTLPVPAGVEAAAPRARPPSAAAAALGADTAAVLAEL